MTRPSEMFYSDSRWNLEGKLIGLPDSEVHICFFDTTEKKTKYS